MYGKNTTQNDFIKVLNDVVFNLIMLSKCNMQMKTENMFIDIQIEF